MFGARLVGAAVAGATAGGVALLPLGKWWSSLDFGGFGLGLFAVMGAVLVGGWRGPRLMSADHGRVLREALIVSLVVVPLVALLTAVPGVIEIASTGADYPLLAPIGVSFFGLLFLGPIGMLVAIPTAIVWAEVVRALLRRTTFAR